MKKRVIKFIKRYLLLILLVSALALPLLFRRSAEIPILMYHFVGTEDQAEDDPLVISKRTFENHLKRLKRWGYRVYSMTEYDAIKSAKKPVRDKGVVLTFDDGNRDFYETIFPLLQKYDVPATNFLIWRNMKKKEMGSMSVQQAKELIKSPLVTFGVHSLTHQQMLGLRDDELRREVMESKHRLEGALDQGLHYFSYPGGFFDEAAREKVKESGYRLAVTTSRKRLRGMKEDLWSIPRIKISDRDANPVLFWFKVSGCHDFLEKIKWSLLKLVS